MVAMLTQIFEYVEFIVLPLALIYCLYLSYQMRGGVFSKFFLVVDFVILLLLVQAIFVEHLEGVVTEEFHHLLSDGLTMLAALVLSLGMFMVHRKMSGK